MPKVFSYPFPKLPKLLKAPKESYNSYNSYNSYCSYKIYRTYKRSKSFLGIKKAPDRSAECSFAFVVLDVLYPYFTLLRSKYHHLCPKHPLQRYRGFCHRWGW